MVREDTMFYEFVPFKNSLRDLFFEMKSLVRVGVEDCSNSGLILRLLQYLLLISFTLFVNIQVLKVFCEIVYFSLAVAH